MRLWNWRILNSRIQYTMNAQIHVFKYRYRPPAPLRKHAENRENNGQTGTVLRQARTCTQRAVPKECMWQTPAHTSPLTTGGTVVQF